MINLKAGDILHVKVGGEVGDGQPWIPDPQQIDDYQKAFSDNVPDGVSVVVTNHLVELTVLTRADKHDVQIGRDTKQLCLS